VTTVGINAHGVAGTRRLQRIATRTGGKYYRVNNAKALPKIYQKEVRRLAKPLVFERDPGFRPSLEGAHEMLQGIDPEVPPITGYVLTQLKASPLVEVSMRSPLPDGKDDNILLASWTYGIGRTVAFTTDAGKRWAADWTGQPMYDKLFSQMIRWSMRPVGDTGRFTVAADPQDGQVKVVVTAWDKDDEYLNFLDFSTTVVGPDMKPRDLKMQQTAPGRYIGQFDAEDAGSYFLAINPGRGHTLIRTGVNVPYSAEYRNRETDEELLRYLAARDPEGGQPGLVIAAGAEPGPADLLTVDSFRHDLAKATSSQDVWHFLLLFGGCLFFFDVFFRRVQVSFAWVGPLTGTVRDKILRREAQPVESEMISRLRTRKEEISERIEQRRSAARFEPTAERDTGDALAQESAAAPPEQRRPTAKEQLTPQEQQEEEDTYTSRLLKAKKDVWKKRND